MKRITCLAATAAVLVVAGCTSDSGSASTSSPSPPATTTAPPSTVTTTATAKPTTSVATPAPTSPSAVASSSSGSADGLRACNNTQLAVSHTSLPGATSHDGVIVVFRNTSRTTCDLFGYPGAAVVDGNGTQFEQAKRTVTGFLGGASGPPRDVVLRPAASASARIEGDNGGGDECLRGVALLVTPPNTKHSTRVPFRDYSCHVQVHPTVAGTKGGGPA